ncbi:GntR family transcriptional regulator [Curtobacterium sp. S6]|uniref:GntR family transcriptional regulator n=1 Tax=Curtobacterium sp. S6 TaxID=1479623 RepID=UPI0004AA3162|nr:GntR family transcriptional regulator [Curtobacterium sp. S6]
MKSPHRAAEAPLWKRVQVNLLERINRGDFTHGMPGELALSEEYGVSRATIRAALTPLRREGLVSSSRGRPSTVGARPEINTGAGANAHSPAYSLFAAVRSSGLEQTNTIRAAKIVTDPEVAGILRLEPDAELVYVSRIRYGDDLPIAMDDAWFPAAAQGVLEADLERLALYDALDRYSHVSVDRAEETIRAIAMDASQAESLGSREGDPAFYLERLGFHHEAPLEWRQTVARGDRFSVTTTYP